MFHLLYKYLVLHDYVSIPGIGHFTIERQPAKQDMEQNVVNAPVPVIKYKYDTDVADKPFYSFLASELNIDVVDAIRQFQDFSHRLKETISSKKAVELPSFGTLKMAKSEIEFHPDTFVTEYYPPVSIDKTSLNSINNDLVDGEEEQETGDGEFVESNSASKSYWWLYALILASIGVGAIVYYYYQQSE
jgi:nucleoid DNA-binding protein